LLPVPCRGASHLGFILIVQFPLQKGSSVALVTPFDVETGNVDMASLDTLLEHHLNAGTTNLCILGTTGEASVLSMSERHQILTRVVEKVKGQMCILVGTGTINPTEIKSMTQQAIDVGCDAALVVTPYYVKPPQRGLVQHMVNCAEMGLPVCMYNVPGRTGVNMLDESLALAAELHSGIVAVKDATGDLRRLQQLRDATRQSSPDLLLYSGDDATSLDFVLQGGDGCISVTANVAASEMAIMMKLGLQGQVEEARTIDNRLMGLHTNLFLESNPIPVKWAVQRIGLIQSAYCRPPLATFDEATLGVQLEESLFQAGLLE
jgi:4-hydroxy-tetrahydrodipicolinate synthase